MTVANLEELHKRIKLSQQSEKNTNTVEQSQSTQAQLKRSNFAVIKIMTFHTINAFNADVKANFTDLQSIQKKSVVWFKRAVWLCLY